MTTIRAAFDGIPFIDSGFRAELMLAVIERSRATLGAYLQVKKANDGNWLDPDNAVLLRRASGITCDLCLLPMEQDKLDRVEAARDIVMSVVPTWSPLFEVPIVYHHYANPESIGCSCYAVPQRVFLSEDAFSSKLELCEQVIHEQCHNWMYFAEELMPFHPIDYTGVAVLPSGTANRNPTEIIGAAHVAASLIIWYERFEVETAERRLSELRMYLSGCVTLLNELPSGALLPPGIHITERLADFCDRPGTGGR